MDKATLKALIIAKGQELGLDRDMIDQMLAAKPVLSQKDQVALDNAKLEGFAKLQAIEENKRQETDAADKKALEDKKLTTAAEAIKRGDLYPEDLTTSKSLVLDILNKEGFKPKPKPDQADATKEKAKQEAARIVQDLEDQYFGNDKNAKLAYGRVGGFGQFLASAAGANPDLNAYMATRTSVRPKLVKAMGDTGNFSQSEQEAAVSDIPTGFNTEEEAIKYFRNVYTKLGVPLSPRIKRLYAPPGKKSQVGGKFKIIEVK